MNAAANLVGYLVFRHPVLGRSRLLALLLSLVWCAVWNASAFAAVTFQTGGSVITGTTAAGLTVPWPAHIQGDVALLFVESTGGQAVTLGVANGFAPVANSPQATGAGIVGTRLTVFWARATSAAMVAPVLDTPNDHVYARMLTFRGVIGSGDPVDTSAGGVKAVASTSVTVTGVTTTVPNALVVQAVARDNDNAGAAFSAETNVNLTGIAERLDAGTANGNGGGLGIWTGVKATAGPTGNTTANVTSSINAFLTIALKPGPAYQAAGAAANNATSVSPAWPAHATNDVALLFVESGGGEVASLSVPAGFAPVANSPQNTGAGTLGTRLTVFWARATSAAMTAPTVTVPAVANSHIYARIITYRNVVTAGNPWDVTGGGVKAAASTAVSVTGITTTVADTLVVQAVARHNDNAGAAFSAQANAALTGIAERSDAGTTTGLGGGFAVWEGYKAVAGATGTTTATVTSSINAFLSIALRPQAVVAPVFGALGAAAVTGLNWPAHAVDDIALLFVESTGGQPATLALANGFAAVANSPQATGAGTAGTRITVFWARATSTAMPGPVLSGTTDHIYARILTYRGVANSGNPWDVTGGGVKAGASNSVSVTGITTTVAGTRVVQAVARDNDNAGAAFSAQANANLSGIVERQDAGTTIGNGGGFAVWDGTMSLAAPTGNTTANVSNSRNAFLSIALQPAGAVVPLHHVRLNHPGTAVTCLPASITVVACTTADGGSPASCTPHTTGLTGNVVAKDVGNAVIATVPFVIGAGTSSVVVSVPVTTAQTVTLETSALSLVPTTPWTCYNIAANNASCSLAYVDSGFIFSSAANGVAATIPAQTAGTTSATYYLRAVRTSTTTKACEAALTASGTVNFGYTCNNPGTCSAGSRLDITPYDLGGVAQTPVSVPPGSSAVTLFFDANGNARHTFSYRDAGQITINASKAAGGLLLTPLAGSTNAFVTAPASFLVAAPGPFVAGTAFGTTVTARTSGGATTPNFGQEATAAGATLSSSNPVPGLGNATAISSAASAFAAGVSATNLTWNEVGTIDLGASTSDYLGSGLNVVGSLAAVGPFIPGYFDTFVSHGCGSFTYGGLNAVPPLAGQPFTVEVKAKRTGGDATDATNTANYAGATWAKDVTLADAAAGTGTLADNTLLATDFVLGKRSQPVNYRFASKATAPYVLAIRATNADGVSSSGHAEGSTTQRSGRLRLQGAYGSDLLPLRVPLLAEYHDGSNWKPNVADTCTVIPTAAVAIGNRNPAGLGSSTTAVPMRSGGIWDVVLAAPTLPGSADIALDLGIGTAAADVCLAAWSNGPSPVPVAASLSYLLGNWCGAGFDKAPLARIKFGSPKAPYIYLRERY